MNGKQFDQKQKLSMVDTAKEIGFKEVSDIAGIHYTTIYEEGSRHPILLN